MRNKVPYCQLAPDFKISKILTGLWQIADMERHDGTIDKELAAQAMTPYVRAGLTTFDMADHYGSSEIITGHFRNHHPLGKHVQLLTKWVPKPGPLTKDEIRAAIQLSLDRMEAQQLDLLQYHAWNYADPVYLDQLFYLQALQQEGLIKHLGVTNFDAAHLDLILQSGIKVISNQICYSLLDQRARGTMTEICAKHQVKILAFGTLAGGFLTKKWLDQPEPEINQLSTWSEMKYKRFIDEAGGWNSYQHLLQTLRYVAEDQHTTIANIACKYILDQPEVGGIIIGARLGQSSHLDRNLPIFTLSISEKNHHRIQEALTHLQAIPGDCGDEYRRPPFLTASGDLSHHLESFPPPYQVIEDTTQKRVMSGTIWEDLAGFSRAVQKDNRIYISGTTATHGDQVIGGNDPGAQMQFIIDKIEGALQSLGSDLNDVVRTRIFIQNQHDWEAVSKVHGRMFQSIQPANTLVQAGIIGDAYLVEMEVEAVKSS